MDEEKPITRKRFLSVATWGIGGIISVGMAIPSIVYVVGPALKVSETQSWISLGSKAKVEIGTPTLFKTKIETKTGWIVDEKELSVYILTENGRDFIALSNVCTHLGCRVRWISDQNQFFCPCHNAVFAKNGTVVSGPPPRPLDRFEIKVENDQLFIKGG